MGEARSVIGGSNSRVGDVGRVGWAAQNKRSRQGQGVIVSFLCGTG